MGFHFSNLEISRNGNTKTVRRVIIKNKKGYKSVSKYVNGKHMKTVRRKLKSNELNNIKDKRFIPELFHNCKCMV